MERMVVVWDCWLGWARPVLVLYKFYAPGTAVEALAITVKFCYFLYKKACVSGCCDIMPPYLLSTDKSLGVKLDALAGGNWASFSCLCL